MNEVKRAQLIYPPQNAVYRRSMRECAQGMGLQYIKAFVQRAQPLVDIEVIDGMVTPKAEILERMKKGGAELVGINTQLLNYGSALVLGEAAHSMGKQVVFGGPHVSTPSVAMAALERRKFLEAIFIGEGEHSFAEFVSGKPLSEISGVAYRDGERIVLNPPKVIEDLDGLPFPERGDEFLLHIARQAEENAGETVASLYSIRGCGKAARKGKCIFCSRPHTGHRRRSAENVWEEIRMLSERFGIGRVVDQSDTFLADRTWVERLAKAKPRDLNPKFEIFARADEIRHGTIGVLEALNVAMVWLGLESGSDEMLRAMNKRTSAKQNERAVGLLAGAGIAVGAFFVVGAPSENQGTLAETLSHAKKLLGYGSIRNLYCSLFSPLPSSPAFQMMMRIDGMKEKYLKQDLFDLEELKRDWVKHFCPETTDGALKEFMAKMRELPGALTSSLYEPRG